MGFKKGENDTKTPLLEKTEKHTTKKLFSNKLKLTSNGKSKVRSQVAKFFEAVREFCESILSDFSYQYLCPFNVANFSKPLNLKTLTFSDADLSDSNVRSHFQRTDNCLESVCELFQNGGVLSEFIDTNDDVFSSERDMSKNKSKMAVTFLAKALDRLNELKFSSDSSVKHFINITKVRLDDINTDKCYALLKKMPVTAGLYSVKNELLALFNVMMLFVDIFSYLRGQKPARKINTENLSTTYEREHANYRFRMLYNKATKLASQCSIPTNTVCNATHCYELIQSYESFTQTKAELDKTLRDMSSFEWTSDHIQTWSKIAYDELLECNKRFTKANLMSAIKQYFDTHYIKPITADIGELSDLNNKITGFALNDSAYDSTDACLSFIEKFENLQAKKLLQKITRYTRLSTLLISEESDSKLTIESLENGQDIIECRTQYECFKQLYYDLINNESLNQNISAFADTTINNITSTTTTIKNIYNTISGMVIKKSWKDLLTSLSGKIESPDTLMGKWYELHKCVYEVKSVKHFSKFAKDKQAAISTAIENFNSVRSATTTLFNKVFEQSLDYLREDVLTKRIIPKYEGITNRFRDDIRNNIDSSYDIEKSFNNIVTKRIKEKYTEWFLKFLPENFDYNQFFTNCNKLTKLKNIEDTQNMFNKYLSNLNFNVKLDIDTAKNILKQTYDYVNALSEDNLSKDDYFNIFKNIRESNSSLKLKLHLDEFPKESADATKENVTKWFETIESMRTPFINHIDPLLDYLKQILLNVLLDKILDVKDTYLKLLPETNSVVTS